MQKGEKFVVSFGIVAFFIFIAVILYNSVGFDFLEQINKIEIITANKNCPAVQPVEQKCPEQKVVYTDKNCPKCEECEICDVTVPIDTACYGDLEALNQICQPLIYDACQYDPTLNYCANLK